ncbi:hypothetical protein GCM10022270_23820 [Terriglobus aquaticus]
MDVCPDCGDDSLRLQIYDADGSTPRVDHVASVRDSVHGHTDRPLSDCNRSLLACLQVQTQQAIAAGIGGVQTTSLSVYLQGCRCNLPFCWLAHLCIEAVNSAAQEGHH